MKLPTLKRKLKSLRRKKIVFTNGCFDLLHLGHVRYLEEAKTKGDVLIVGLNSDKSVRRIKQKGRPIMPEVSRAAVLAALASVDYVVLFDEATPLKLISAVKPDILVKGADYRGKDVVGKSVARRTLLIKFTKGYSTSKIVHKILRTCRP